jgi:carbonic anhydrase
MAAHTTTPVAAHATEAATPKQASQRLIEGNARFVAGHAQHAHQDPDRRTELANSQHPFAVILGCADSRTGPELLFDQGLGDLFVVREAGNVLDDHTLGSIEYAAEHLHAPLIVVLGHERCGAIAAAREPSEANGHTKSHIDSLVEAIRPAVEATKGQDADATCKANVANMVRALKNSDPLLKPMVAKGEVEVVGAYYDLDTGVVTFLPEP